MPAIKYHKTPTTDSAWDGPAQEAKLSNDAGEAVLRLAFAWIDADKDPNTKAAYRFVHHECEAESVGAANVEACRSAIGELNGARGGTTIPEADRKGVYDHLAAHLKDAEITPPDLRTLSRARSGLIEHRAFPVRELRASATGEPPCLMGYAAVFNSLSDPLDDFFGSFQERIAPGAFSKSLQESDAWALWCHDPSQVLGRMGAGTLKLNEDPHGLAFTIHPPDTQVGRDAMESCRRGDVTGCSFGFRVVKDHWTPGEDPASGDPMDIRTLNEIRLYEISPTPMPAYPATDVSARALLADAGVNFPAVGRAVLRARRGLSLTATDRDVVGATIETLRSLVRLPEPDGPRHEETLPQEGDRLPVADADHSESSDAEPTVPRHSRDELRRQMERLTRLYDRA